MTVEKQVLPMRVVLWHDAFFHKKKIKHEYTPNLCKEVCPKVTVGFVLSEDETNLVLAQEYSYESHKNYTWMHRVTVPKALIQKQFYCTVDIYPAEPPKKEVLQ